MGVSGGWRRLFTPKTRSFLSNRDQFLKSPHFPPSHSAIHPIGRLWHFAEKEAEKPVTVRFSRLFCGAENCENLAFSASESLCLGSIPSSAAIKKRTSERMSSFFIVENWWGRTSKCRRHFTGFALTETLEECHLGAKPRFDSGWRVAA